MEEHSEERLEPRADRGGQGSAFRVWTVSQVTRAIRELLEGSFGLVAVEGEITNFSRPQSGHLYFSLMEGDGGGSRLMSSQLPCVLWRSGAGRLRFRPENGLKVVAHGRIGVYEPRGVYQLIVERLEPAGLGELQLRFEQLKERLRAEGLFDPARKRRLPFLPRRIGLITSPTGAAIEDVLRVLYRRHPKAWVRIVPVRVQGEGAAEEIAAAVEHLQRDGGQVDVMVLARGGGSLEDLWPFNEEVLARAVAASTIPTVAAVGHEVDFSIVDFVADVRAQTPTQAAELLVPDQRLLHDQLSSAALRLAREANRALLEASEAWSRLLNRRSFRQPQVLVQELFGYCDEGLKGLEIHLYKQLAQWEDAAKAVCGRLNALHPLRVLERGYAVATHGDGRVIRDASILKAHQSLRIQFARGAAKVEVLGLEPSRPGLGSAGSGGLLGAREGRVGKQN